MLIEHHFFQDSRSISGFIAYALCAADEALRDANWLPSENEKKERTVPIAFSGSAFPFLCFVESLDLIRDFVRVFQLVGGSEASQTF